MPLKSDCFNYGFTTLTMVVTQCACHAHESNFYPYTGKFDIPDLSGRQS